MAAPVKLRIILGENDSQRLALQDGFPETVGELVQHIKRQCGVENFRLQFMDAESGNEFTNLTSMSEIQDKSTLFLIQLPLPCLVVYPLDLTPLLPHQGLVMSHHFHLVASLLK